MTELEHFRAIVDQIAGHAVAGTRATPSPRRKGLHMALSADLKMSAKRATLRALRATLGYDRTAALVVAAKGGTPGPAPELEQRLGAIESLVTTTVAELDHEDDRRRDEEQSVRALAEEVAALRQTMEAVGPDRVARLAERAERQRTDLLVLRSRVDLLLGELRGRAPGADEDRAQLDELAERRFDDLYVAFEALYRGSPEDIRERLSIYLPDIAAVGGAAQVVDVGSGRGEWLALLRDQGVRAVGVDLNAAFVAQCTAGGLDAVRADAIAYLDERPESSLGAVTAFHIVEHLPFDRLIELVDAALRALRPGGCLIMETPNPLNLVVGSASFHLDPTHLSPLHPMLLEFVAVQRGFVDVEVRELHPQADLAYRPKLGEAEDPELARMVDDLNRALHGPRDYAVLAWRSPGRRTA